MTIEVRDQVVVAVLAEGDRDAEGPIDQIGRDFQLRKVTFLLQGRHPRDPTKKMRTCGARKCANFVNPQSSKSKSLGGRCSNQSSSSSGASSRKSGVSSSTSS